MGKEVITDTAKNYETRKRAIYHAVVYALRVALRDIMRDEEEDSRDVLPRYDRQHRRTRKRQDRNSDVHRYDANRTRSCYIHND